MSNRFFTSDQHIGHAYLANLRGFARTDEHDECQKERWNSVVGPKDIVFVQGDVALGTRAETLKWYAEVNGTKHLILGNHDNAWPGHRNAWRYLAQYLEYFATAQAFARIKIGEYDVLLSHFPYEDDHVSDARYTQYRLRNEDMWLLHGHTHSKMKWTSSREIHIGVDAWDLTPVPESTILRMMNEKTGKWARTGEAE